MPQVQQDPTLSTVVTNGGTDLFSYPNVIPPSILELQTDPSQPLPAGTDSAANLLAPDLSVALQLKNFPSNVYDVTPTSLLTHFMQALLGAPGAGQLRNRQMIARLQQAVTSTHFYDLDSFYGALFGAQRGPSSALPTNPATGNTMDPYTELASPDGWDEIEAIDALFRERIIALAQAITLGATPAGMQAIGEAITGGPCQVYETFRLIPNPLQPPETGNTWETDLTEFVTWDLIPAGQTWAEMEGSLAFPGLMGNGAINEVVIRPRKTYATSQADLVAQGSEMYGILSVAEVLRPAAALVSVDNGANGIVHAVPVSAAWSDSEYCEVSHLVTPTDSSDPDYAAAQAAYQAGGAIVGATWSQPRPPFTRSEGSQYSYVADVSAVTGQGVTGDDPNSGVVINGQDFETVFFPAQGLPPGGGVNPGGPVMPATGPGVNPGGPNVPGVNPGGTNQPIPFPGGVNPGGPAIPAGKYVKYTPPKAIEPPGKAATARTSSGVTVKSAPYSGQRVPVTRAT